MALGPAPRWGGERYLPSTTEKDLLQCRSYLLNVCPTIRGSPAPELTVEPLGGVLALHPPPNSDPLFPDWRKGVPFARTMWILRSAGVHPSLQAHPRDGPTSGVCHVGHDQVVFRSFFLYDQAPGPVQARERHLDRRNSLGSITTPKLNYILTTDRPSVIVTAHARPGAIKGVHAGPSAMTGRSRLPTSDQLDVMKVQKPNARERKAESRVSPAEACGFKSYRDCSYEGRHFWP